MFHQERVSFDGGKSWLIVVDERNAKRKWRVWPIITIASFMLAAVFTALIMLLNQPLWIIGVLICGCIFILGWKFAEYSFVYHLKDESHLYTVSTEGEYPDAIDQGARETIRTMAIISVAPLRTQDNLVPGVNAESDAWEFTTDCSKLSLPVSAHYAWLKAGKPDTMAYAIRSNRHLNKD